MSKKLSMAFILGIILSLMAAGVTHAQRPTPTNIPLDEGGGDNETRGSIRGTVYEDRNGDGQCSGTDDPIIAGIPVEFVSNDGQVTLYLQSGENGTYGLVAAGLGTWTVTVRPPENYVVTSAASHQVLIDAENRVATGVDFCVRERATGPGPGGPGHPGGPKPHHPVVLPESGAPAETTAQVSNEQPAAFLLVAALVGVMLIFAGGVVTLRERRKNS